MAGNREYKSDVFSMLMEDKNKALQLYNAVNRSDYADSEMVELRNLEKGISLSIRNDAAFVLDMSLSIYEHQSTVCPNMPVRSLVYFAVMLKELIKGRNIYGRKLVKIPTPRFVVFYNGDENQPEQYDLRLSDSFEKPMNKPEIELVCRVYNINKGKNEELLGRCPWLREYMTFVDYVREYHRGGDDEDLRDAIERAIDRCIEENVLADFLWKRRLEVVKAMTLDYTFERQIMLEREEARTEGRQEGLQEGRQEGLQEGRQEGRQEGIQEGIRQGMEEGERKAVISICKKLGMSYNETVANVKENFSLGDEDIQKYMKLYW